MSRNIVQPVASNRKQWLKAMVIALAFFANVSGTVAVAQTVEDRSTYRNLHLTLQARKLLMADPLLAAHNVGVHVENRVATLWGPLPSEQLISRALATVRDMPNILEVRNYLFLDDSELTRPRYLPAFETRSELGLPVADSPERFPPPRPTSNATTNTVVAQQTSGGSFGWQARPPQNGGSSGSMNLESDFEEAEVRLSRPIAIVPAQVEPMQQIETKSVNLFPADVQMAKGSDARFQLLTVAVDGRMVRISGTANNWADVHELARHLSRVSGVERVVIGEIQIR